MATLQGRQNFRADARRKSGATWGSETGPTLQAPTRTSPGPALEAVVCAWCPMPTTLNCRLSTGPGFLIQRGVDVTREILWALALATLLSACAATAPDSGDSDLACSLPSNCVNSRGTGALAPLRYTGTPARALEMLQATVATFPEATVVRAEALALESIFTTPVGFKDKVDFKIDAQAQRIDFRSRSLFGLFDFGKNRSRMREFATRFQQQSGR